MTASSENVRERIRALEGTGLRTFWEPEPLVWARTEGCHVWDAEGRSYLDLYAGFANRLLGENFCQSVIPVEIPGVIGATADGHNPQTTGGYLKSFYSSFGIATADVVAPGGDSRFGVNAEAPNGRVLSAWPASQIANCLLSRRVFEPDQPGVLWCYQQGTSMASPHVAGVAALIISRFGPMSPGTVAAYIGQTADPQPCASAAEQAALSASFPSLDNGGPQVCQGGTGHNSWYGAGQVNALSAVTHTTSAK